MTATVDQTVIDELTHLLQVRGVDHATVQTVREILQRHQTAARVGDSR
jgi:hypothetical protein